MKIKRLLFILLHGMAKLMLSNTCFPKKQTKMPKTGLEKHHMILHVKDMEQMNHKEILSKNSSNTNEKTTCIIGRFKSETFSNEDKEFTDKNSSKKKSH